MVERALGPEGAGRTYLCRDGVAGAVHAVIEVVAQAGLPDGGAGSQAVVERLLSLEHPGLVRVRSAHLAGDPPHLVVDYVEGQHLGAVAAGAEGDAAGAVGVMADVCDALRYLHGQGRWHGDVQPGNIIVGADGAPRLVGLGLPSTATGPRAGDPTAGLRYAPPEAFNEGSADLAAGDVYAVGVVLFELLTGQQAFGVPPGPRDVQRAQLEQVKRDTVFLDPGPPHPDGLRRAVRRLTAADLGVRISTAAGAAELLHAIDAGRAVPGDAPRKPGWLLVLGSALMLLIVVSAAVLVVVAGVSTPPKATPTTATVSPGEAADATGDVHLSEGVAHAVLTDSDGKAHGAGALRPGRYALRAAQLQGGPVLRMELAFELQAGQTVAVSCDAGAGTCQVQ